MIRPKAVLSRKQISECCRKRSRSPALFAIMLAMLHAYIRQAESCEKSGPTLSKSKARVTLQK